MLLAMVIAFGVTGLMGPKFIPYLRKLKFGQSILEDGPTWHMKKQGTPTMGGIMFIVGIFVACAVCLRDSRGWVVFITALFFGAIGFIDDYTKVVKKRNLGLTPRQKSGLQILVAVAYLASLQLSGHLSTMVYLPFLNMNWQLSWLFYPFAVFVIVGTVNSVNLTDGLDGLATSVTTVVALFFGAISFVAMAPDLGVVSSAVVGGLLAFLMYNKYPAKVFMGDTGSLFLGGMVCALAFAYNQPVLLIVVGLVYVCETLSVILQVASFKLTGKRIFKMAPLHHHFEMCGKNERQIVYLFTGVTILCCIIAYLAVLQCYG
ncbi:MAG: phospho-N-acetylmuramoyl-pentapeptide-transferase [Eubacteriales bacterium]